jgi:hypothetical protein
MRIQKWSQSKRLFVKVGSDGWRLAQTGWKHIPGTKPWTEVAIHDEIKLKITGKWRKIITCQQGLYASQKWSR